MSMSDTEAFDYEVYVALNRLQKKGEIREIVTPAYELVSRETQIDIELGALELQRRALLEERKQLRKHRREVSEPLGSDEEEESR